MLANGRFRFGQWQIGLAKWWIIRIRIMRVALKLLRLAYQSIPLDLRRSLLRLRAVLGQMMMIVMMIAGVG